MSKEGQTIPFKEKLNLSGRTHIGMLIDPYNQNPLEAGIRTSQFAIAGGDIVLVGGSGDIKDSQFQKTVDAVVRSNWEISTIIFPGYPNQIPESPWGIAGVLNYSDIMGAAGYDFGNTFPLLVRDQINVILKERGLKSVRTLYVLCGDPSASVSQVTKIPPIDLGIQAEQARVEDSLRSWLRKGIECIFIEAGSGAAKATNPKFIEKVRYLIDSISPDTLLFVGGGITTPRQAKDLKGLADVISIGTYFEDNGLERVDKFLAAVQD